MLLLAAAFVFIVLVIVLVSTPSMIYREERFFYNHQH